MIIKNKIGSNSYSYYSLNVNNEEFLKYGLGLYIYFDIFKKLVIIFFIISFLSLIPLVANTQGDGVMIKFYHILIQISFMIIKS